MDGLRFRFLPRHVPNLPQLAWCATVRLGKRDASVVHGSGVFASESFIAEGAWAGDFSGAGLLHTEHVVGSGLIAGETIVCRGSSHNLERLWCVRRADVVSVSNSLPLVLAVSRFSLPLQAVHLEADLLSFIDGERKMRSRVWSDASGELSQLVCANFAIDSDLKFSPMPSRFSRPDLSSFDGYLNAMAQCATAICKNAGDTNRPVTYKPLATVSRGYDSPACAVLARSCGADAAITFASAREGYRDDDDDGTAVAQSLGLSVSRFARQAYAKGDGSAEIASLASGGGGEDVVLAAATEELRNTVLFTGFFGDTLWGLYGEPRHSEELRVVYPGGGSMAELRLTTGFAHLPIPALFLRHHAQIRAISRSAEMEPWRLNTEYDRPIPRRIAEQAGVPRGEFGRTKMAISAPMYYDRADSVLGTLAQDRFSEFVANRSREISEVTARYRRSFRLRSALRTVSDRIAVRLTHHGGSSPWSDSLALRLSDRYRRPPSPSLFLVHWAVDLLKSQYENALAAA
jgi:hypothetical protein